MLPSQGKPKKLVGLFLLCTFLFISFLTTSAAEGATGERERAAAMSAIISHLLLSDAPLATVSDTEWNETAVRKVLQTFSYGGFPSDSQITLWADMRPQDAIAEIMTFDPVNTKLSPPDFDNLHTVSDGTLEGLARFFSSDDPDNPIAPEGRELYEVLNWAAPHGTWIMAANTRGLNPFRQRVELWETNYHMSVNQQAGVHPFPVIRHYDNIMGVLENLAPYEEVLSQGALNAATAYQYGHNHNFWFGGKFYGNEDFAREFHQLFFGILGEYDHEYHELVSIKNTAKALTGMQAQWHPDEEGGPDADRIVIMVCGEFGRQLAANGGGGTDHGVGNAVLLIGRNVNGGIYGDMFPQSEIERFAQPGTDIEGRTSVNQVIGRICEQVKPGSADSVVPSWQTQDLEQGVDLSLLFP